MAAASDVPARYDLVLSGGSLSAPVGFVFLDALEPSLPFRTHRAIYGYSPTFIERQNVSGSFGDNQQDFFLTSTQRDWSEGEQQRYFRGQDPDSARRYWQGSNIDVVDVPGSASIAPLTSSVSFAAAVTESCDDIYGDRVFAASTTNIYRLNNDFTITDFGAHGLGTVPTSIVVGGQASTPLYASSIAAGSVGVRAMTGIGIFATFSATKAHSLTFLNNTLYGYDQSSLIRYDTAGTATTVFTWKNADGGTPQLAGKIVPFGGKLLILRSLVSVGADLWLYDGTAPAVITTFSPGFEAKDIRQVAGTAFISGVFHKIQGGVTVYKPAIFYYSSGTIGLLWQANGYTASIKPPALVPFNSGLVWSDDSTGRFLFYNPTTGGFSAIGAYTVTNAESRLSGCTSFFLHTRAATTSYYSPADGYAASASVTTSLIDFDSSLTKFFRGITIDFDSATDGNGGTVDIAYRVGDVDGSYTTLQTGAVSGTEYILTGITGHSISAKVTLNKGTSTSGPVLKRVSVRAAPILTSYRTGEYVLDCTGDGGRSPRTLRDATPNPLSGFESLAQLQIAKASTTPLTVTDRTGTYTGIVEQLEAYEEHPGLDDPTRSGEFVVKLIMRGI